MIEINLLPEELRKKEARVNLLAELPVKRGAMIFAVVFFGFQALATVGAFYLSAHFNWAKMEVVRLKEANRETLAQKTATALIKKKLEKCGRRHSKTFFLGRLS